MTKTRRLALASAAVIASACAAVAAPPEPRRDGPWAFTERAEEDSSREQMAATPAAEDNDVWLVLVCARAEVTASLMHNTQFPPSAAAQRTLTLRSANFPVVTVGARLIQRNQLSIDSETTRHIFPLVSESDSLVVSMNDPGGAAHSYTFSLQPHGVALAGIVQNCLDEDL